MNTMKLILRIGLVALYIVGYFVDIYKISIYGPIINTSLLFLIMVVFVDRKISILNYLLAFLMIAFYVYLFFTNIFDIPAKMLGLNNKWWFYGALYTVLIVGFGTYVLFKRKNDTYQFYRTLTVIFVQLILAFIIPISMYMFDLIGGQKDFYFSYLWPLKIEYFYPSNIFKYPLPFILYSFLGSLILFPILAITLGKRFYCSWVCGCGGLANTFGDHWRHLSNKSKNAWQLEKITIHGVLILAVFSTFIIIISWALVNSGNEYSDLTTVASKLKEGYGFFISFSLAATAGVGFYPVLGTRVWCRFFCPMAAMIGLFQKTGRYHIRVKKDMCISCGNCSTYCEMGIDVRSYAEANQNFTRASCVGCGLCAHVCPRGVLRLENGKKLLNSGRLEKI